jgi:hypothetical protein
MFRLLVAAVAASYVSASLEINPVELWETGLKLSVVGKTAEQGTVQ